MKSTQKIAKNIAAVLGLYAATLLLPGPDALAKLGGNLASIQADATAISGTLEPVQEKNGYSVYVIRSKASPIRILKEYLSQDGIVVGIAVSSHGTINSRRFIEESYYQKFSQARMTSRAPRARGRMSTARLAVEDAVVETSGHLGRIVLRAYLPQKLPATLSEDMISPRSEK